MSALIDAELILLAHSQVVKYCRVAPAALWAFDYLLTFDHELKIIWKAKKWSYTHAIFFIVRYLPVVGFLSAITYSLPSLEFLLCLRLYKVAGCSLLILMVTTEGVLCLRTLALWYNRRMIKAALVALYLAVCVGMTVCIALVMSANLDSVCSTSSQHATPHSTLTQEERLLTGAFCVVAAFEFVIICLTLAHSSTIAGMKVSNRLLESLQEGNLLYATTLFAMSVANTVFFDLPLTEGWTGLLDVFQGVLHGVMASRIILSLRSVDRLQLDERIPETWAMSSLGPMEFASSAQEATKITSGSSRSEAQDRA